jgi:hypothetical protein
MYCSASMLRIHNQRQSIALDDAMDGKTKSRSARTPTGWAQHDIPALARVRAATARMSYLIVTLT